MNASDQLQLIRALEEGEASRRRRSNWVAWASVLIAAAVLVRAEVDRRRPILRVGSWSNNCSIQTRRCA